MRPSKRSQLTILALVLIASGAAVFIQGYFARPWPSRPLDTAYYVWQVQWNDGVREALQRATPSAGQFMVLLGEVNVAGDTPTFSASQLDWKALSATRVKTTLVLRAGEKLSKQLAGDSFGKYRAYISGLLKDAAATARENNVTLAGVQLDYDSPTSGLGAYRRLLDALRGDLPEIEWSITTLPTWLRNGEFSGLVKNLSYYVLQVHSLEPPSTIDKATVLFDPTKTMGYLRRAAAIGVPFYLALPTYGYQVAFDEKGRFIALSAEGPSHAWKPGVQVKTTMANPTEIAATVQSISQNTPPACLGIVWFRLPVESDDLNWTWPTLEAVRHGRAPTLTFAAEIRSPSPDLYEVWVSNTGESNSFGKIACVITWLDSKPLAYDLVNSFQVDKSASSPDFRMVGPAPRQGKPVMAGWFRFPTGGNPATPRMLVGAVMNLP